MTTIEAYWRKRCLAAEAFIAELPCDPDIYPTQYHRYSEWQEIVNSDQTQEVIGDEKFMELAEEALQLGALETMEVMGYNVIAKGGWVVKVYKDGIEEKIKRIGPSGNKD